MRLHAEAGYERFGMDATARDRLSVLGDLLLGSPVNVTGIREPEAIEQKHFLDSLSLLEVDEVVSAEAIVDVGSGGGFPALAIAIACPEKRVVALESTGKKCVFMTEARDRLGLEGFVVKNARAEDYGRDCGREYFDVAVTRAVGPLSVEAELALPLVRVGGAFIAMKGALSSEELGRAERALVILGAEEMRVRAVTPFSGAENRRLVTAIKKRATPERYPRRAGIPAKRPLGGE